LKVKGISLCDYACIYPHAQGEPADNAARFIDWLRHLEGNKLENVRFAVFGCGNSDWSATFQKIPILCDELLEKHGGSRLVPRGAGDAGSANFFQTFDDFEANLWTTLSKVRRRRNIAMLSVNCPLRNIPRRVRRRRRSKSRRSTPGRNVLLFFGTRMRFWDA
jgi:sulfite reductase alpha subunit-like flavoprotein